MHEELAEGALSLDTRMHPCGRNRPASRVCLAGDLLPARGSRGRCERPTAPIRPTDHCTNVAYRGDRFRDRRDPAVRPSNILLKIGRCTLLVEVRVRLSSPNHLASICVRWTLSLRHDRVPNSASSRRSIFERTALAGRTTHSPCQSPYVGSMIGLGRTCLIERRSHFSL
jgi:hypothetical protein